MMKPKMPMKKDDMMKGKMKPMKKPMKKMKPGKK